MTLRKLDREKVEQDFLETGDVGIVTARSGGFRRETVLRVLNGLGYNFRRVSIDTEEVARLHAEGLDDFKIADRMQRPVNTVTKARNRMKLPVISATYRRKLARPQSPKYDHDRARVLIQQGRSAKQVASALGCSVDTVYRIRVKLGLSNPHPAKALAPWSERYERAAEMVEEGASFADINKTTHIAVSRLRRDFPGKQWTAQQCGEYGMDIRYAEKRIREVWDVSTDKRLTKPPLKW